MSGIEGLADREVDHRVAEIFEALVMAVRGVGVLVEIAAVDEGLVEEILVPYLEPEAGRERGRRAHRSDRSVVRTGDAETRDPRTSARRCSPPRPGRS